MRIKFGEIKTQLFWKIRQVKKLTYYKPRASSEFAKNQKVIVDKLLKDGQVLLQPIPPYGGDGDTDNYFHFIFDLLLPLYLIFKEFPNARVGLDFVEIGYLKSYIFKIFPHQVFDSSQNSDQRIDMHGMNPLLVHIPLSVIQSFKTFIIEKLNIKLDNITNKVVLIERTTQLYNNEKEAVRIKTGSLKRSIKNHNALRDFLNCKVREELEVVNVKLELCPLEEQIQLFDKAHYVIAQHGAGIANIVWMRPESCIVEFRSDPLRLHYRFLAKYASINYFHYFQNGNHITLSLRRFKKRIKRTRQLKQLFNA